MIPTYRTNITRNCTCVPIIENEQADEVGNDATWLVTSAFVIFTMQSGFGLVEAGAVSQKNEANIMIKNAVDVIFGGLSFWVCGFAFSFGDDPDHSNYFTGYGLFFTDTKNDDYGYIFAKYFFQLSFATTATTIVSGAMAERTNLKAYMLFSFLNLFSYVFPAHWIWDERGFLYKLGAVDVAGAGPVHLTGGVSAVIATVMLKPRAGFFDEDSEPRRLASPTNLILGTFMLWWGWLGFNCGSTFGVSGGKWKLASRTAVVTINGSVGGGMWSIFYCYFLTKDFKGKLDIGNFTACLLGGLVSITAICAICRPWEALLIGLVGGIITSYGAKFLMYIKVDDPVTCIPIHAFCGAFGMIVVGLCGEKETEEGITANSGVFKGGPVSYLGYQCLAVVTMSVWAAVLTFMELFISDKLLGLRMSPEEEEVGADYAEHGILPNNSELLALIETLERRVEANKTKMFFKRRLNKNILPTQGECHNQAKINFGMKYDDTMSLQEVDGSGPWLYSLQNNEFYKRRDLTQRTDNNSASTDNGIQYTSEHIDSRVHEGILVHGRESNVERYDTVDTNEFDVRSNLNFMCDHTGSIQESRSAPCTISKSALF